MPADSQPYRFRPPRRYQPDEGDASVSAAAFDPPADAWLEGTWWVTHTSLPLWSDKRNVRITYTVLPRNSAGVQRIDDLVAYQPLKSDKVKTVHGVDTPEPHRPSAWQWRGKGLLAVTSSQWEILGYGVLPDGQQWAVTYFAKTLFTPEGIDIYSRSKDGLPDEVLQHILHALTTVSHPAAEGLLDRLYQVTMN